MVEAVVVFSIIWWMNDRHLPTFATFWRREVLALVVELRTMLCGSCSYHVVVCNVRDVLVYLSRFSPLPDPGVSARLVDVVIL